MSAPRVLIGCECSGAVRRAFRARGCEAFSCDLKPAEDGGEHIRVSGNAELVELLRDPWALVIIHPPCTFLNVAGMHWTTRGLRDPQLTEDALELVRKILGAPVERLALENPVGIISTRIRKPDQYIQPYQFGEDASKKTGLWLKGLPLLTGTQYVKPRMVCKCGRVFPYDQEFAGGCPNCGTGVARPRWGNQTDSGQNRLGPSPERATERSRTYLGIASAMAEQWGQLLTTNKGKNE